MRKVFLALVLVAATALAVGLPAAADPTGDATPACADIIPSGSASFASPSGDEDPTLNGPGTVSASFEVAGNVEDCSSVTYALTVSWGTGSATKVRVDTSPSAAAGPFVGVFSVKVPAGVPSVCAFVTTSSGSTVLDRSPDTGCLTLVANAGSPGGGGAW
jgi:hypothetical protein